MRASPPTHRSEHNRLLYSRLLASPAWNVAPEHLAGTHNRVLIAVRSILMRKWARKIA